MEDLEYITKDALMICDQGAAPDFFKPTFNTKTKIHGCLVATKVDFVPLTNIPSFKICKVTQKPCIPVTSEWKKPWQVKVNGEKTLIGRCTCKCSVGGTIEFMTSGQVPLPDDAMEEVKAMQDQAQKELDDSGNGDSVGEAGFVEGMIPVWGSGRDLVNSVQTGDGWGIAINAGFLIWDVASIAAGVFTAGGGTAAMQAGKTGLKGVMKAGVQNIGKKALAGLGKVGFKKLNKEVLKNGIDSLAKKLAKTCVFACFPAGTPIYTEFGVKKIEDIQEGDLVWAYNENNGEIALKEVLYTMVRESDHTINIYTEYETIETTALHPFYVDGKWIDASELQKGDRLTAKDNKAIEIIDIEYVYEAQKVYNFEVDAWHTYFVGFLCVLVHNAGRCLSEMILKSQKWFQKVRRGYFFNLVWNSEMRKQALEKGFKYSSEVVVKLKNGKKGIIDGLVKTKDGAYKIIERKATDLSKVTEKTAKSYIDDAAHYAESTIRKGKKKIEDAEIILHVEKIGDVSQNVLKHAEKRVVKIVEDMSSIF